MTSIMNIPLTEILWVIIPALSAVLYAAILYSYGGNWRDLDAAERWLMLFVAVAALWGLSSVLLHVAPGFISPEILIRLVALFNFAMPLTVYGFTAYFLSRRKAIRLLNIGIVAYFVIAVLILTGKVVYDAHVENGVVSQKFGPAMIIAAIYWVVYMYGAGLAILREWRRTQNTDYRNRLAYILGVIFFLTLGNTINVTPLQAYPLDQLFAAIAAGLLALSLAQQHVLSAQKALPRIIGMVIFAFVYVFVISASLYILGRLARWTLLMASVFLTLISTILLLSYEPLRRQIYAFINNWFFEEYDVNQLLYNISQIATYLRLPQALGQDILKELQKTLDLENAALILRHEIDPEYRLVATVGFRNPPENIVFPADSPFVDVLADVDRALTLEELAEHPKAHGLWQREWDALWRLNAAVIVPITSDEGVIGGMVLGPKRSGRPFTLRERRHILPLIANQIAIALANSRLYAQVQKEAEMLAKANEELRELNKIKTEMVQNVSHELRTPLTLIQGYAELLAYDMLNSPEKIKEAGEIILEHAQHLRHLVEQLLAFQRLQREGIQLKPFDLREWLHHVFVAWEPTMERAGLRLTMEVDDEVGWALGNPEYLRQVIDNLMDNARKFSKPGGEVRIRAWKEGDEIYIAVSDQGIGVPPEKLPYLFERFYQVDGTATRRYGGMGIGLALCKEIVEMHGGRIWAESEGIGKGLTVTFTLKSASPPQTEQE